MIQGTAGLNIHADTIRQDPIVSLLRLEGRFDAEGLPPVLAEIEKSRTAGSVRFIIDLREVSFIGSAGIGIFLSLVEECQGEGGRVVFLDVPDSIQRIFEVLNVLEFLEITQSREDALKLLLSDEPSS